MTLRDGAMILLLFSATSRAGACSCGPPRPPLKAMAESDAVFSGEIIDIIPMTDSPPPGEMPGGFKATVKVMKSWKGDVAGIVQVHTGSGFGDCGIELTEEPWLFYAGRRTDGEWYTGACQRSRPLKYTGEEIAELDGHLPELPGRPQEPNLQLKGRIDDAGYKGYVFTLSNRLHKRLFYCDYRFTNRVIQVWHNGRWVDYAPSNFSPPKNRADAARTLAWWRGEYGKLKADGALVYLDRSMTTTLFVGGPLKEPRWRVGFQYLDEQELDAGKRIQRSTHYVWSEPIQADTPMEKLSFKRAFDDVPGIISDPLGTQPSSSDH